MFLLLLLLAALLAVLLQHAALSDTPPSPPLPLHLADAELCWLGWLLLLVLPLLAVAAALLLWPLAISRHGRVVVRSLLAAIASIAGLAAHE